MSWGIDLETSTGAVEVFDGHTYNLTPMWRLAGVVERVTRELDGMSASVLADKAAQGLARAVSQPTRFEALNPENGWGDYEGFVRILTRTATVCAENRSAIVRWNG